MDFKRPDSYKIMTDEQKEVLIRFYRQGMTSTTMFDKIKRAAEETNLSAERVKKWIGNFKRKEQKQSASHIEVSAVPIKNRKRARKLSAQNVFYSKLSKEGRLIGLNNQERNQLVNTSWKELGTEEKREFECEAKRINDLPSAELSEDEKRIAIRQHRRRLENELTALEDLGIETALIMIDEKSNICNLGSEKGVLFLQSNQHTNMCFKEYFDVREEEEQPTYKDLQLLFNTAYAKAIGCEGARVPYLKGNFEITGLPASISWRKGDGRVKKPSDYGPSQIKEIMKQKELIRFMIRDVDVSTSSEAAVAIQSATEKEVPPFFLKLVPEHVAQRALLGNAKVSKDELEILGTLRESEEEQLLQFYKHYFEDDAWLSIEENFQHQDKNGTLLATYTASKKSFWLFYYSGILDEIEHVEACTIIPGKWLNQLKGEKYAVLAENATIKRINLIVNPKDQRIISLGINLDDNVGDIYRVPRHFLKAVKDALKAFQ